MSDSDLDMFETDLDKKPKRKLTINSETEDSYGMLRVDPPRHKSPSMKVLRHISVEEENRQRQEENGDETDLTAVLRACRQ